MELGLAKAHRLSIVGFVLEFSLQKFQIQSDSHCLPQFC